MEVLSCESFIQDGLWNPDCFYGVLLQMICSVAPHPCACRIYESPHRCEIRIVPGLRAEEPPGMFLARP